LLEDGNDRIAGRRVEGLLEIAKAEEECDEEAESEDAVDDLGNSRGGIFDFFGPTKGTSVGPAFRSQ